MNRSRFSIAGASVLIGALLVVASPAVADDGGFTETFDEADLAGWERQGDTIVESGILTISPPGMVTKRGTWSDIALTVKFRFGTSGFAVIDYHVGEGQHYSLTVLPGEMFLERITADAQLRLWEAADVVVADDWNTAGIEFGDGEHTISLNDEVVSTVSDADSLVGGGVRLHVPADASVEFDEVILQAQAGEAVALGADEPAPEEGPPAEGEGVPPGGDEEPAPVGGDPVTEPEPTGTGATGTGLFDDFFASQPANTELRTFAVNLVLAALVALILGLVYVHWGTSLSNRRAFAANFMLLTVTTTSIILVVRSSVALSLGLVGALSIVRFRAAIKEPEELAYLFLAIGLGIGLGDNQRLVVLLTLIVAIIVAGLMKLFRSAKADVNLHLAVAGSNPGKVDLDQIVGVLKQHCSKLKLLRLDESEESIDTSFLVEFKRFSDVSQTSAALKTLSPTIEVTLLDNKGIW
ncbi:MAG: DUF4956 domain-containing protein [Acidimicrobiia bacterium]|nr:DUF4956 domain-containing protein [Acidimicrobiia bacterium]